MNRWLKAARVGLAEVGCPHSEPQPAMCCALCSDERDTVIADLLSAARFALDHAFVRKWPEDERAYRLLTDAIRRAAPAAGNAES